nr:MFS transporter [Verminephrobacter eiseniae]
MTVFLAAACGLLAANIYYAQPLVGLIGESLGLPRAATGLIVTMAQIGYGAGLLLIVPLGDLFENRRLTLVLVVLAAVALLAAGVSTQPGFFLAASLFVGLGTVAVQVLVPYAAHMAPEAERGRVVGNVMSGLMLGIMLARPVASFITQLSSWHVVFMLSGSAMAVLALLLGWMLPQRVPTSRLRYVDLLASMGRIATTTPLLRRRALYHACLFGAFSLFWTTTPLLLTESFHLSQGEIALFALAGVAGAIAAPIAGRVADRGWTRIATLAAMLAVAGSFLMTLIGEPGSHLRLAFLVVAAVVLDFGVSANMTLGQRAIFGLDPALRARLNGLYMTTFFIGGALGSGLGGWAYAEAGWWLTCCIGFALPVLALLYFTTEPRTQT